MSGPNHGNSPGQNFSKALQGSLLSVYPAQRRQKPQSWISLPGLSEEPDARLNAFRQFPCAVRQGLSLLCFVFTLKSYFQQTAVILKEISTVIMNVPLHRDFLLTFFLYLFSLELLNTQGTCSESDIQLVGSFAEIQRRGSLARPRK